MKESIETTISKYPVEAVHMMRKIIVEAEKWGKKVKSAKLLNRQCTLK